MKKRAVLFLLVLCTVLCVTLSAMAAEIKIESGDSLQVALEKYQSAVNNKDVIIMMHRMIGADMTPYKLNTRMVIRSDIVFDPTGLCVGKDGVLAVKSGEFPVIVCDITNYGTIESGIYTGTITNYGTITGGTFLGKVINATDGTNHGTVPVSDTQAANMSRATLKIQDASEQQSDGKNDDSFAGAYITVTLELAADEHIEGNPQMPQKILRGGKISTYEPTRDGDPATTQTVFAYWQKKGSTGTNDVYAHEHFFCPGREITVTPVWCDHVVKFEANPPKGAAMLSNWMLPLPINKEEGKKNYSANQFMCYKVDENNKPTDKLWYVSWNTRVDGKGQNYSSSTEYTPDFDSGTVTTMYARWATTLSSGTGHKVVYQPYPEASESEKHTDDNKRYGVFYTLPKNMFTPERGKEFNGWEVQGIEDPPLFQPGDTIMIVPQDSDDPETRERTYITAQWRSLPVTELTFDANGTGVTGTTGTGNKENYYLNEKLPLPQNGFTRPGFTFAGWNTRPDGTGTPYTDKQQISITGELAGDGTQIKKVTLYAQWKAQPILINQQPEDQSVMEGQPARFATDGFAPVPTTLSYQWYVDKGDGNGFVICPGETAATLDIAKTTAAQNGYRYRCVLSNGAASATTSAALLTVQVILPPKTGDPANSALWLALCLMSLGAMAALTLLRKQNLHRR